MELSTAIALDDPAASVKALVEVAQYFRLDEARCQAILGEVLSATATWRKVARRVGLGAQEIEGMELAFEHEQRRLATEFVAIGIAAFG